VTVAALFCREDSHYKDMAGVDAFDERRNALTWPGGSPGVFHPPCRGWGKLKGFSTHLPGELELARWSMRQVRRWGGVVEHPLHSSLWRESGCLGYGIRDDVGGVLIPVNQSDYGHRADKATCLYLVGLPAPQLPFDLVRGFVPVENMGSAERDKTPLAFARFLVDLALKAGGRP